MNMNDFDQNKLNQALKQLGSMMSKDDINNILNTLKNTDQNEVKQQLGKISKTELNQVIAQNPSLKNIVASNPDFMKNLNSLLSNQKR